MKKYSEIVLSDEEKKVLDWLKSQDYTHIGRSSNYGFIEVFDNQKGFSVNLKPMRKPFEFIENGERYEIDKLLNPPHEPNTVWDLEDGEEYFVLNSDGSIGNLVWSKEPIDINIRNQGNMFLTKEDAEYEKKRREVFAKVKKYARPFRFGEPNWYAVVNHYDNHIDFSYVGVVQCAELYFESKEKIKQAIAEVGEDDFKKYYLGVTE